MYGCLWAFIGIYKCLWVFMTAVGVHECYACLWVSMGLWVPMGNYE